MVPSLSVDESVLRALPGSCGTYQRTRLRAISDDVDYTRLLSFSSTDESVLKVDASLPGYPMVVGASAGRADSCAGRADPWARR